MNRSKRVLAVSGLVSMLVFGSYASAQSPPTLGRWPRGTQKPVMIHRGMPAVCDEATWAAASTWSNQGANFRYTTGPVQFYDARTTEGGDDSTVQIEDGWTSGTAWMRGTINRNTTTTPPTITDADFYVKSEYLFYYNDPENSGEFHCVRYSGLPSNQVDYESVMVHELGHGLGFDEWFTYYPNCVMYYSLGKNTYRRTPCSYETNRVRTLYQ